MSRSIPLLVPLALAALLAGCKGEPAERSASQPPGTARSGSPAVDCKKVLPQAVRDRWLAGMSEIQTRPCPGCATQCRFFKEGSYGVLVTYDCARRISDQEMAETARVMRETNPMWADAPGLGRSGLRSRDQVIFWDRDTACTVTLLWPNGQEDLLSLARAAEEALGPAALSR